MPFGRRDLFRLGGLGGGLGILAGLGFTGARKLQGADAQAQDAGAATGIIDCDAGAQAGSGTAAAYEAAYMPASYLPMDALDALHMPPPPRAPGPAVGHDIELPIIETTLEVAAGRNMRVWTYGGRAPGPIIRATAGDTLRITLVNRTSTQHSIHFHGSHDVMQDGLQRVAPGARQVIEIEANPGGLHPYHCHMPPYAWHLSRGMYGAMIVDPPAGRAPAHEFVLCLCGWDLDGDGRNEIYAWNGIAGFYHRFPLKVPVGELVRIYLLNMVEYDPVASFHLHAQTFDVYRSGTSHTPHDHTDVVTLGQTERAVIEFRLPRRGRYMFHPHQIHMADKGAMGWIVAI
jgi:FtsP/CotA-like multicopper oxidase with cupredoxin domain